jgi:thiol-disulfide isomerase/thioredoxin
MRRILITVGLTLFSFVAIASEGEFCGVEKPGTVTPCNVKGGTLSKKEITEIVKKDSTTIDGIYKEMKDGNVYLYMFYSYDCPHCKKAHAFLEEVKKQYPQLIVHQYEIKKNKNNVQLFRAAAKEYNVKPQGVPTIFIGNKNFVGFDENVTCKAIIKEIRRLKGETVSCPDNEIDIPFIGTVNTNTISLPAFTFYVGLLDGLNPCAMWVLAFLLGLLVYAENRKKMMFLGTTFVIASGVVYFLFMTAWVNIFLVIGYSKAITIGLGIVAIIMGLVNIKELFFFKKGVTLMIPESAKPKLYKKARAVIYEESGVLAVIGTIMLAVFVNFIELGCTIGLPAIYTRVLSLRGLKPLETYLYIGLYNVLYIVPLIIIVAGFTFTMGHFKFAEGHGKILKVISGLLMLGLGIILMAFPQILVRG